MSGSTGVGYARAEDGVHVAYKTWGHGLPVHVFLPEFGACVDSLGQHPAHIRFERFIGSLSRCVCFDPRGIGGSDPVAPDRLGAPEDWAKDLLAVLDAVGADRIVLTGEGYSGHAAAWFAVRHPDRVERLMLLNAYARLTSVVGYDIGSFALDDADAVADQIAAGWGTGSPHAAFSPALASDPSFLEVCGRIERAVCSPGTARAMVQVMARSDARELLPQIAVPTLVYYTGDLAHVSAELCRHAAAMIPGAVLLEAPGRSFYQPDESGQLDDWAEFIVGGRPTVLDRRIATILFVDVVGSTAHAASIGDERWMATLEDLDRWVQREIAVHGGRLVKQTGDGHLATFETPNAGLAAAWAVARGVHVLGVEVRCGLHVGEVELRPGGDIGGIAVHLAARVVDKASPGQVLLTRTVAELAAGAAFSFEDRGVQELKGIPGAWQLLEATTRTGSP